MLLPFSTKKNEKKLVKLKREISRKEKKSKQKTCKTFKLLKRPLVIKMRTYSGSLSTFGLGRPAILTKFIK